MNTKDKTKLAHFKGYRVNNLGELINPKHLKIKGFFDKDGRNYFNLRDGESFLKISVAKLQAFQKFGDESFKDGVIVRHLNQIATDNSYDNIAIGTRSDSMFDQSAEQRLARSKHASSFIQKYEHDEVYQFYKECRSYKKTMEKFSISSKGTLNYIIIQKEKNNNIEV
jgi:hypothetical protein